MNQLLRIMVTGAIVSLSLFSSMLLTGCETFYQSIPKDTVMVKAINKDQEAPVVTYDGSLSDDALKSLSMNALNKIVETDLKEEDFVFNIHFIDSAYYNELIDKIEHLQSLSDYMLKMEFKLPTARLPNGISYVTLVNKQIQEDESIVAIDAKTGEIYGINRNSLYLSNTANTPVDKQDLLLLAEHIITDTLGYDLTKLELIESMSRLNHVASLYYMDKETQELKLSLNINSSTKQFSYMQGAILSFMFN